MADQSCPKRKRWLIKTDIFQVNLWLAEAAWKKSGDWLRLMSLRPIYDWPVSWCFEPKEVTDLVIKTDLWAQRGDKTDIF